MDGWMDDDDDDYGDDDDDFMFLPTSHNPSSFSTRVLKLWHFNLEWHWSLSEQQHTIKAWALHTHDSMWWISKFHNQTGSETDDSNGTNLSLITARMIHEYQIRMCNHTMADISIRWWTPNCCGDNTDSEWILKSIGFKQTFKVPVHVTVRNMYTSFISTEFCFSQSEEIKHQARQYC